MLEDQLWFVDSILKIYLWYLIAFDKPHWCYQRRDTVTSDCVNDLYGNDYNLWMPLPFTMQSSFPTSMSIMFYFMIKQYIIFFNLNAFGKNYRSARLNKLLVLTFLGLSYFLFYFLMKDKVFDIDICSLFRLLFFITLV